MRIVSLNAWGGALADDLLPWLSGCAADIVCLQEVTRTPGLQGWTRFDDGEHLLPQRADLFDDVRNTLPRHQAIFVVSDAGPVHDDAGGRHRQDFGLGTFVGRDLPLVGVRSDFVHGRFVVHDEWAVSDRPRVALAVRVITSTGRGVTVVQAHGLRDSAGKHDTPARRSQAEALARVVTDAREAGDLLVVCGDLNLLPTSATFAVLARVGLVDLVGDADTRTSRYVKPVRHASYLLVSDRSAVRRFEIVAKPEVSDHRALVLDV